MQTATIPLVEWLPDQPALNSAGLLVADGVWPIARGFRPLGQFSPVGNGTLAADCLGATSARSNGGATFTVAGTAGNLYRYSITGWTSIGSGYTAGASVGWRFDQWGNWIIATNGSNAIQKIDMGGAGTAAALGGSPPTAELVCVVRDFLVLGRVAADAQVVRWSAINNAESWALGVNQASSQQMPTGGEITGITGGEFGIVLQERRVSRMSYVGPSLIFQFDELSNSIGCMARGSVARVGPLTFFLSYQGFAMCDGTAVRLIGDEKVNRTALSEVNRSFLSGMSACVDPRNSLVVWAMPNGATSTRLYIYNYALDRWSTTVQTCQRMFVALSEGVTLEQLSALYPVLETVPASLDDDQWKGGAPLLMLIDGSRMLGGFGGSPRAATFTTGDLGLAGGRRCWLQWLRAEGNMNSGVTVTVEGAARRGDAVEAASFTPINRVGVVPLRSNWPYPRITVTVAAGTAWSEVTALEVGFVEGGL